MNMRTRAIVSAMCLAVLVLAGCAKPRTGPFDVPAAAPGRGGVSVAQDSDVRRAAGEIAAARIYFAFNKYDLRPDARQTLSRVAELLRQYPAVRIAVHGHCDERGPNEYNYVLGERRARAAYGYLVRNGVSPSQLEMVTHGKKSPAVSGKGEAAWALNRRDEFIVLTLCN